ncbi:HAD family hydrolase [Paenibacillus glycanilyticus]|uniref:HAD-IIB family hydrolase n=1 Tax=Paenibacillus glycanilyticus TaxID=126569 RepID=UPI00203C8A9F|nr:HAD-IIB family hydrolase [Paenibacillus glycanilyticus]MCM3625794.1 HAD family hydrolase [Paenibacillus glycanilyticus]
MPSCYLTDLDGTLLRTDQSLSDYTVAQLKEALEAGTIVSYATARSYMSSERVTSIIPWRYPVVLYNGAMIFDPIAKRVIEGNWLSPQLSNDIMEAGRLYGLMPLVFALDERDREKVLHEKLYRSGEVDFYNSRPDDPRFQEMDNLKVDDSYRPLILTYIGLYEELQPLKLTVEQQFGGLVHIQFIKDAYIKDHYFLEMSHPLANKGEGARIWAKLVGSELEDVTVFGDNLNDLGMFRAAGTRIAVADAHEQIKQLADSIIGNSNEDAVARYIAVERSRLTT